MRKVVATNNVTLELVQSLMGCSLVDVFVLLIHPLVLGAGRRLFANDGPMAKFEMTHSVPTTRGVLIATYEVKR